MVNKGQKHKKYTKEMKEEILKRYQEESVPAPTLGKEYGIPTNTIKNWVYKTQKGINVLVDHRELNPGRPKKEEKEMDYKERYEILKKYQAFLKARREKK